MFRPFVSSTVRHLTRTRPTTHALPMRRYAMLTSSNPSQTHADRVGHQIEAEEGVNKPSVADNIVMINFIDKSGLQRTVPGYVGQTLMEVARNNDIDLDMNQSCSGAGTCGECHVLIANEWYNKLPQTALQEDYILEGKYKIVEKLTKNSRLACQIVMEKEYDGLVVAVANNESDFHFHFSPF